MSREKQRIDYRTFASTGGKDCYSTRCISCDQSTGELFAARYGAFPDQSTEEIIASQQSESHDQSTEPSTQLNKSSNMAFKSDQLNNLMIIESTLQDEIMDDIEDNTPETINQSVELMKSCIFSNAIPYQT